MALIDSVIAHLSAHGPHTLEELHVALLASGATRARTPAGLRSSIASSSAVLALPDGRYGLLSHRLRGVVLTVRPRARLGDDVLWVHRDLEPFALLGSALPLASGGVARRGQGEVATLIGPPGWLPDCPPGQLLAFRWDGRALHVSVAEEVPTLSDPAVQAVRVIVRDHLRFTDTGHGYRDYRTPRLSPLGTAVVSALAEVPALLSRPVPPLRELLPLDEEWERDTGVWEVRGERERLTVRLPKRVHEELERRADALGDDLAGYAAMLLGAAADRLRPVEWCACSSSYRSSSLSRWPEPSYAAWDEPVPPAEEPWALEEPEDDETADPARASGDNVLRLRF